MKKLYMVFMDGSKRIDKELKEGETVEIGRCGSFKVCLKYKDREEKIDIFDSSVSRNHARIFWKDGMPYMVDLGSRNGTKIDGIPVPGWRHKKQSEAVPLLSSSKILIGSMTYVSIERRQDTLTFRKGDSVKLTPKELEKLKRLNSVKVEVKDGEPVIGEVKQDTRIKTDSRRSVKLQGDMRPIILSHFSSKLLKYKWDVDKATSVDKIVVGWEGVAVYAKYSFEFVGDFYNEMALWIRECEQKGHISDSYRREMIKLLDRVIGATEEVMKCDWM